jgi:uncharacterized membrane protein YdjX (TVP38/TMEM64 family)
MLRRRVSASVVFALWGALIAVTWTALARADGGPAAELARWLGVLVRPGVGVPVLLAAFAVRPLLLIPVTVLTAFAGWWLGPWLGFAVAWGAVTASAAVPYGLARALRGPTPASGSPGGWRGALGRDPFRTVLVARLMMLPGDLVSAAAGAVRVPWGPFLGATALGGAPGLAVGVLAGAALDDTDGFAWSEVQVDPTTLVAAAVAYAVAGGLAWALRRRSRRGASAEGR